MNDEEYFDLIRLSTELSGTLAKVRARIARANAKRGFGGDGPTYRIAIRPDDRTADPMSHDTLLDDIVVRNVPLFRAEQMDRNCWWVACYLDGDTGDRITWDVRAKSKPLRIEWTAIEFPEAGHVYEHELRAKS